MHVPVTIAIQLCKLWTSLAITDTIKIQRIISYIGIIASDGNHGIELINPCH